MNNKKYKIEQVKIKEIKPATYNPRKHDSKMLKQLESSIKEFGLIDPIIVNKNENRKNILIGGHARYKIAKRLKYKEIPVVYINLNEEQEKILNVKLNKISGDWDFSKLTKLFDKEFLIDLDFNPKSLQSYWDNLSSSTDDDFNTKKELKKIHNPKTEKGDLIIMGPHKLLCSSATDPKAVKALFNGETASMYYSDSPYNINYSYSLNMSGKKDYGGDIDDDKSPEEYKKFIRDTLTSAMQVLNKDTHYFMYADEAWIWVFQTLYNELGIKNRRVNIWVKNNSNVTPNVAFNKVTEFCVYGTTGKPFLSNDIRNLNEIMNKNMGTGNQLLNDISNLWAVKRLPGNSYSHPTEKNPELHEKAIKRCTKKGDIIFDSFSGSASTMVCAEQLGRAVYSLEISEVFCDIAIRRYEALTGKKVKVIKKYYEKN